MNGLTKVVIDTNIIFMFFYNPVGKAGTIIKYASEGRLLLYAPDTVKAEIGSVLRKELGYAEEKIKAAIEWLPVKWIDVKVYEDLLPESAIVKHKPDRPLVAVAMLLGCGILSADKHFKPARKFVKIWNIDELIKEI